MKKPKSYHEIARFCEDSVADSQRKLRHFAMIWSSFSLVYSITGAVTGSLGLLACSALSLITILGMRQFLQRSIQKMLTYRQEALGAAKEYNKP